MDAVAASEVQKAQASTACANPLIALNELLGSDVPGPAAGSGAALPRLGARPHARPRGRRARRRSCSCPRRFTVTGTEDWWRQVAQVGWLVPEAYIPATELAAVGNPFITSRVIRVALPRVDLAPDRRSASRPRASA